MNNFTNDCITCKTKTCSVLKNCDNETLADVSQKKNCKEIKKGKILFSEDDIIHGVYFIKKGFLKVELNGKIGRPLIASIATQGSMFGHRVTANQKLHTSTVTAIEDCEYCYIPLHLFQEVTSKSQTLKDQISCYFLKELEQAEKSMIHLAHKSVREKIAIALLMFANYYNYTGKKSFTIHFGRQEIADFTGTTKEQVSKVLKDFKKESLIKCKAKQINYLNLSQLEKIAYSTF